MIFGSPSGRKMMVFALEPLDGMAMYVGKPAILSSVPAGVPVARVPERQHFPMVGWADIIVIC